jgi:hypothetical protein
MAVGRGLEVTDTEVSSGEGGCGRFVARARAPCWWPSAGGPARKEYCSFVFIQKYLYEFELI